MNDRLNYRSCERQRADQRHLPRLTREHYCGRAFVHWTLTLENRATGWLTPIFHAQWKLVTVHACSRYRIALPTYVLMPDHIHILSLGINDSTPDQRVAIEFIRKTIRPSLAPADWQSQAYDHVLRDNERECGAFQATAQYVLENPVRGRLCADWKEYPYIDCCIAGYPELDVKAADFWDRFWRCYNYLVTRPAF